MSSDHDTMGNEQARTVPATDRAFQAALEIASELDVSVVLQRLVNLAREVVPSQYSALGIARPDGYVTEFITSGISAATRLAIGPIPQGHGMLGVLIRDREPLLVPDIAADPRSVGFPPNHPPMKTLLGVPVMFGNRVLGNLYLTEREGGRPYDQDDLSILQVLAAHAASAIERAQLFALAEQARHEAEERRDQVQIILNSMPAAVLILRSPDGIVESANAAAYALIGRSVPSPLEYWVPQPGVHYQLLNQDDSELPPQYWPGQRSLQGEVVRNKQLTLRLADSRQVPVLMQSAPLRDAFGAINRAVVVIQDITQFRAAEQLKDDFLSLVSHEMRTPLTSIHGGAQLLTSDVDKLDQETRNAILDDIRVESGRLDRTLTNILTLTGIQAGRIDPDTEPVMIQLLVRQLLESAGSLAPNHRVTSDIPADMPPAEGDPELLAHVIRNLIENAAKYSPVGSTITLKASHDHPNVTISVVDVGFGIAPEHLDEVFERFRRPGADPGVRGMGLGLYLSRHLVEAQGGKIAAASEGKGKGATFHVTLPVASGWYDDENPAPSGNDESTETDEWPQSN
jgi:signal transduction histidine kinase